MPDPKFRHVRDLEWHEVRAQQLGQKRLSVTDAWFEFTPDLLCAFSRWDPGVIVQKHGHNSPQAMLVLEGDMMCGDVHCTPGMHITLEMGASFGPSIAGPRGVLLYEISFGDPRSWPADPEGFERLLAERGVTKLPNPEIPLPEWLEDTRN